jgi:uncharacterized protein
VKRFLVTAILCFTFTWTCLAQQSIADSPATKEDVERYLQTVHSREMINQMMDAMSKPMHQMVHDEYMKNRDKLSADFEAQTNKRMDSMLKDMPWDEMLQAMVPTYQKHLTKGDIDALVAFYSSSTGQKLLRELPSMMSESMQSTMPIMRKHMERVNQSLKEEIAEALKKSQKVSSQSPALQN